MEVLSKDYWRDRALKAEANARDYARLAAELSEQMERRVHDMLVTHQMVLDGSWETELRAQRAEAEVSRLRDLISSPETERWFHGVAFEAAHQVERWGASHDAGKSAWDWFWLIGFLAQKAAAAAVFGDVAKAKHHTISTAAALLNWHRALNGRPTPMRRRIATPAAEEAA